MFLSGATSQNSSFAESIGILLAGGQVPQLFGTLGFTIPEGTQGVVSVQFQALVTISATPTAGNNLVITIVRGKLPSDPLVYSSVQTAQVPTGGQFIYEVSATAADFNVVVPPTHFLEYTAFISSDFACTRIGPESFEGFAFNIIS